MTTAAVKITRKGQVTIPKEVRDVLQAEAVYFEVEGDLVLVRPARDASGALREYARNARSAATLKHMKTKAWVVAVREKARKKSS